LYPVLIGSGKKGFISSKNDDYKIRLWNATDNSNFKILTDYNADVQSLAFSSNGMKLASASAESTVVIWNTTDWTISQTLWEAIVTTSIVFYNETIIISGDLLGIIKIWDLTTSTELMRLTNYTSSITSMALFKNNELLVSGNVDGTIQIWNTTTWTLEKTITSQSDTLESLTLSPDGGMIASAHGDNIVKLWNISTGNNVKSVYLNESSIHSIDYSPDGENLVMGGTSSVVKIWNINQSPDFDVDGLPDGWEIKNGQNPAYFQDKFADPDNDGLINSMEYILNTDPLNLDSDNDSISDGWEYLNKLNPLLNDADLDNDNDSLSNAYEYQMDLDPTIDDRIIDHDGDMLSNLQESLFGSSPYLIDTDHDGMPDNYEFTMMLNPVVNDSLLDKDSDLMTNLWEFQMGLNATDADDAHLDSDSDGMSNVYEFIYGFDAIDPGDAYLDSDGDFVSNLDEYRSNTNPRDFWSVPLISFSIFHIWVISLISIILLIILMLKSLLFYRSARKKRLIDLMKAPDYLTAVKIQKTGYRDYHDYSEQVDKVKLLLEKGKKINVTGEHEQAIQLYEKALEIARKLEQQILIAEIAIRLVLVMKEQETLTASHAVFKHFPEAPYEEEIVKAYKHMQNALIAETKSNWGSAKQEWSDALNHEDLDTKSRDTCQLAIMKIDINSWLSNPNVATGKELIEQLENLCEGYRTKNLKGSLCKSLLLQHRVTFALFQFDETEGILDQCREIAERNGLKIYLEAVNREFESFTQQKHRMMSLMDSIKSLTPENREKMMQEYIKVAVKTISEEY